MPNVSRMIKLLNTNFIILICNSELNVSQHELIINLAIYFLKILILRNQSKYL